MLEILKLTSTKIILNSPKYGSHCLPLPLCHTGGRWGNLQSVGRLSWQLNRLWAALGQFLRCAIQLPVGVVQVCLHGGEAGLQNSNFVGDLQEMGSKLISNCATHRNGRGVLPLTPESILGFLACRSPQMRRQHAWFCCLMSLLHSLLYGRLSHVQMECAQMEE